MVVQSFSRMPASKVSRSRTGTQVQGRGQNGRLGLRGTASDKDKVEGKQAADEQGGNAGAGRSKEKGSPCHFELGLRG